MYNNLLNHEPVKYILMEISASPIKIISFNWF